MLSDIWEGLDGFYTPGEEVLTAQDTAEVVSALSRADLARIGQRARERTLDEHTSSHRARELVAMMEAALSPPAEIDRPLARSA